APPAVAEVLAQCRLGQAVAVGQVLPMAGKCPTVRFQFILAEAAHQVQDFAFGVGGPEGQAEVMQQSAQQGAIEQAQGCP
ncbi:hypothetical protein NL460_29910, partial [Klebsiella pneumoniae]|nr:hypothetical protein [Klebsiella pneumoniae]